MAELKVTYAKEDKLTELLDEAREYKTDVGNGTEQLLDQFFAAREAEQMTQRKITELKLQSKGANARADQERSRVDVVVNISKSSPEADTLEGSQTLSL